MTDQPLEIVRTDKDNWIVLEEDEAYPLTSDLVVHYLKGRTRQEPKLIRVIDPFDKGGTNGSTEDTG